MGTPGAPAARYDEWADWYETYMQGAAQDFTRRTSDALVQVLGRGAGPVLDLACGTGFYAPVLRRRAAQCRTSSPSAAASRRPRLRAQAGLVICW